ncbi:MAG: hypothetical protein ABI867_09470 [Kofleriaceae bacterium]
MVRLAILCVLLGGASTADAGACARPDIPSVPITRDGAAITAKGGVVVTLDDVAKPPAWQFTSGKRTVPATAKTLGPGLVVLAVPAGGDWVLADDKGTKLIAVKHAAVEPKPLPAPKVSVVTHETWSNGRRGNSTMVLATIEDPIPADAVALVVLDDKGAMRSFLALMSPQGPGALPIYNSGSCTVKPNGTLPTNPTDVISLAWIDSSGRTSALTKMTVKSIKTPAKP